MNLDSVLDSIELSAMRDDCIYQVDLWLTNIGFTDPVMIQFLIGHSERSSLLWQCQTYLLDRGSGTRAPLKENLQCERFGRIASRTSVDDDKSCCGP